MGWGVDLENRREQKVRGLSLLYKFQLVNIFCVIGWGCSLLHKNLWLERTKGGNYCVQFCVSSALSKYYLG